MNTFNKIKSYIHVLVVVVALVVLTVDYIGMSVHMYEVFKLPTEILNAKKRNWHEGIWIAETVILSLSAVIGLVLYSIMNFIDHYKQVKSDYNSYMTNRKNKTPETF